eukprot:12930373-Prorocentrum_lima.AAC.1
MLKLLAHYLCQVPHRAEVQALLVAVALGNDVWTTKGMDYFTDSELVYHTYQMGAHHMAQMLETRLLIFGSRCGNTWLWETVWILGPSGGRNPRRIPCYWVAAAGWAWGC